MSFPKRRIIGYFKIAGSRVFVLNYKNSKWISSNKIYCTLLPKYAYLAKKLSISDVVNFSFFQPYNGILHSSGLATLYIKNGKLHREDGPALIINVPGINDDKAFQYYLKGDEVDKYEILEKAKNTPQFGLIFSNIIHKKF